MATKSIIVFEEEVVNHKDMVQTCLKELLAVLESEDTLETNLKSTLESLQKYLHTLFLRLLKQRIPSSSSVSYGVVNVKSFQDTKRVLKDNMCYLTENTGDWTRLKVNLHQRGLLSVSDIQKLESIPDDEGRHFEMYNIIAKQPDWPKKSVKCLRRSNNEHIADAVSEGLRILKSKQLRQRETYLNDKEQLITRIEGNLSQQEQYEKLIKTSRSNTNSVVDEITPVKVREVEVLNQIESLNEKVREANNAEAKARSELKTTGIENKIAVIEELEERRRLNITIQNQKDGLQGELEKLKQSLRDKNNHLEILKQETEILETELKNLLKAKTELQDEIDRLNANYNAEKSHNQETMNLLAKIKLENIQEVLKLRKQIEELEDERYQLLINRDSDTESALDDLEIDNLNKSISNLEESAQDMSREAMINCTVDPEDELWELFCSRLFAERKLELNELECRFNNTKRYADIHQNWIEIHISTCRKDKTAGKESSGMWTKSHEVELERNKVVAIQTDRFGYTPNYYEGIRSLYDGSSGIHNKFNAKRFKEMRAIEEYDLTDRFGCLTSFYEWIRSQYIEDNVFRNKKNYKSHTQSVDSCGIIVTKYDQEYKIVQRLTKGAHAKRLNELYEAFGLIKIRKTGMQPCGCRQTDSTLPCMWHANLFRCLAIARLSTNTTLIRRKIEQNNDDHLWTFRRNRDWKFPSIEEA